MGYILFTQSGTFNPSSYGLVTGDLLQLVVVGGGASGSCTGRGITANGGSGGTSSFGSILSALGGAGRTTGSAQPAQGSRKGQYAQVVVSSDYPVYGAPGWYPGIDYCYPPEAAMGFFGPINGAGAGTVSNKYTYSGAGFGAGGGAVMHNGSSTSSTYNASGGNAGEIIMGSHILSSTAAIAITVGIGGVPSAYSGSYAAKGADGCVAVFW